jgi:hypothetical protein
LLIPELLAAGTIGAHAELGESLIPLFEALVRQGEGVQAGDLAMAERMLMSQAQVLGVIFNQLASKAARAKLLPQFEVYMRLALRAQNQARTTLETLALVKNPVAPAFIRQQNLAINQQVNNGLPSRGPANEEARNGVLAHAPIDRLDARAQGKAITAHPHLGTVAVVDRPEDRSR